MKFIGNTFIITLAAAASLALGAVGDAGAVVESQTELAPSVQIQEARFGLLNTDADGKLSFVPATVVPLKEGQSYAWFVRMKTDKKQVKWREEFTLPAPPQSWGEPEAEGKRTFSADSRTSVTERVVEPVNGQIYNSWAVVKGDPAGKYSIRVFVEGRLAGVFNFEVR